MRADPYAVLFEAMLREPLVPAGVTLPPVERIPNVTTLIERARAFLDCYRPADRPWSAKDAEHWLYHDGDVQRGLKAAHQFGLPNSVIADEIAAIGKEKLAAVENVLDALELAYDPSDALGRLAKAFDVKPTSKPEAPHPVDVPERMTSSDAELLHRSTDHQPAACGDVDAPEA